MVKLWWSSLVAADHTLFRLIDPCERARAAALARPADQGRALVAAVLLRVAVGEWLAVLPTAVRVDRRCAECGGQHGRPRILGPGEDLPHVSVSHSGVLVVVTVAEVPVGVDVQRIAELPEATAGAAARWVAREAAYKLGGQPRNGTDPAVIRAVSPPLEGYAAAVATRPEGSGVIRPLIVCSWPAGTVRLPEP